MDKYTIKELKSILKKNNLPQSGTKNVLLKRVKELQETIPIDIKIEKSKHTHSWVSSNDKDFMNFINTEFKEFELQPEDLSIDPCKNNLNDVRQLFEHQKFLKEYFKAHNEVGNDLTGSRGIFLYHTLGSGKTTSAINMAEESRVYKDDNGNIKLRKICIIIPASLRDSPWIEEVSMIHPKHTTQTSLATIGYNFIHYNNTITFIEQLDNLKEQDSNNPFDNSIVIVDEVHNILNTLSLNRESVKWKLYNYLMTAKNVKIIFLSATPIVNDPFEITFALNILRGIEIFDVNNELSKEKFYRSFYKEDEMKNKNVFKKHIQGLISHYRGASENAFAKKITHNVNVPMSEGQWEANIRILDQEKNMSKSKQKIGVTRTDIESQIKTIKRGRALKVRGELAKILVVRSNIDESEEEGTYHIFPRENNNFNYPKNLLKELNVGHDSYPDMLNQEHISKILPHLDLKNKLEVYSPKMKLILDNIFKTKGPVIVFSNFEGYYGIKIFVECLKAHGFGDFLKDKKEQNYTIWSGNTTQEERKKILKIYNSDENTHGEKIKVICLTTAGKEGISLRNVRQIHIMEPWWNLTQTLQVIGRGVRICSHSHLPKEERIVDVYNYISVAPEKSKKINSQFYEIDNLIMKKAYSKFKKSNEILEILKESSLDCELNKEYNNVKNCINFMNSKDKIINSNSIYKDVLTNTDQILKEISFDNKKYYLSLNKIYEYKEINPKMLGIADIDIDGNIKKIKFLNKDYDIVILNGVKFLSKNDEIFQFLTDEEMEMGMIPIKIK